MKAQFFMATLFLMACGGTVDPSPDAAAADDAAPGVADASDAGSDVCLPAMQICPQDAAGCGWVCAPCTAAGFTCPNGDTSAVVYLNTCNGAVGTCEVEQARCGATCALDGGTANP